MMWEFLYSSKINRASHYFLIRKWHNRLEQADIVTFVAQQLLYLTFWNFNSMGLNQSVGSNVEIRVGFRLIVICICILSAKNASSYTSYDFELAGGWDVYKLALWNRSFQSRHTPGLLAKLSSIVPEGKRRVASNLARCLDCRNLNCRSMTKRKIPGIIMQK